MKNTEFDPVDLRSEYTDPTDNSVDEKAPPGAESPAAAQATTSWDETNVPNSNVSRETVLEGTSVRDMYRFFRRGSASDGSVSDGNASEGDGMPRLESLYNALYLTCHNRYNRSSTDVKEKYKTIHEHPRGWSGDKKKLHKNNGWSLALGALGGLVHVTSGLRKIRNAVGAFFGKLAHIPHSMDSSARAIRAFFRVMGKSVLPVGAILLTVYTGVHIAGSLGERYAVGVYVDGVYAGNTDSVNGILDTKHQYEKDLSLRYGSPVVLECELTFLPCDYDEKTRILPGDTAVFDSYVDHFTESGYGLYVDGRLAAVAPVEKWFDDAIEDVISLQEKNYKAAFAVAEDDIDRFIYNNNITVIADKYPESYFLSRADVRKLFSLPELTDSDARLFQDNLHFIEWDDFEGHAAGRFTYSLRLDYSNVAPAARAASAEVYNVAVPAETVSVELAVVKDESERVVVPFEVETVYDETMPEGMRRLVRKGSDGEKIVRYKSTYRSGKLVKRDVTGEEILTAAVSKIVRVGTKELTDEERALIPTGTYLYPYQGKITSDFGWRVLGGQNNFHQGLDIYGRRGEPVTAADGGEVIEVGYTNGYGKYCKIRHNEDIVTRYAHCDSIDVEVGDLVGQGFPIGTLGDTGNATGVHVHFEIIKNGTTVDPIPYMTGTLPYAY